MTPTHAFVGLERISGVMAYDVTNPAAPTFAGYVNTRNFSAPADSAEAGDLGPEGLLFIAAGDSPNGSPLLVVSNEVSGTVAVYQVGAAPAAMPAVSALVAPPGRPGLFADGTTVRIADGLLGDDEGVLA